MEPDKISFWRDVLMKLKIRISNADFITWFKNTAVLEKRADGVLVVGTAIPIAAKWLKERFQKHVLESAREVSDSVTDVIFEMDSKLATPGDVRIIPIDDIKGPEDKQKTRKVPRVAEFKTEEGLTSKILDAKYSLQNFVVGPANRLAHAVCSAVSVEPGRKYNPLFIYGSVGLGKTHLLQATGNAMKKRRDDSLIIYVTAETFVNDYVYAIKNRKTDQFNDRYRRVDALIIDDIQFFSGKDGMQQAFFHVFNTLYDSAKQIIISSDRPPKALDDIDKRLKSRFEMGMVTDIQFPDFETRLAILQEKVQVHGVIIDTRVLSYIAENVTESVRELEGVLMQAIAEAELENTTPTIRSVDRVLRKLNPEKFVHAAIEELPQTPQRALTHQDVIAIVARHYSVDAQIMLSEKRNQEIVLPRQIAMYLIKSEFRSSLDHIGKTFGGRNHTTVLHAINAIKARLDSDRNFARDVNALRKEMGR